MQAHRGVLAHRAWISARISDWHAFTTSSFDWNAVYMLCGMCMLQWQERCTFCLARCRFWRPPADLTIFRDSSAASPARGLLG